ncbi:MAG: trigger factor [Candidatus Parcubacteria bacterium]|nr:trigger factor [Candidatus Parcubacteria bacterium]
MKTEIKKLPKSLVEIMGTIDAEEFESFRGKALTHMGEHAELPGFRKGHVPGKVIETSVGEMTILEEMAEIAIESKFPEIIMVNKIDAIGHPTISITKLAKGNPFEFKIVVAVLPEIELPDYKKLAEKFTKEPIKTEVTNEEVEKVVMNIRKQRAPKKEGETEENATEIPESELPPIDEEFLKSLGDFKSVDDLKKLLKDNMAKEKEQQAKEKRRMEIIKAISEETKAELPDILIESEQNRMIAQFKHDVSQMVIKFEDYLKHLKKTEEDMRKEWEKDAEARAKTQLIIDKIAETEKLSPEKDLVTKEVEHIMEHYTDADQDRTRSYVEMIMTNEKVLELLETPEKN